MRPPRRRAAALLALLAGACLVAAPPARADEKSAWAHDPLLVYYPRHDCRGDRIELEVFDRDTRAWVPHPAHPRVPVETCQVEDAGRLWNEIRWRCDEPPETSPPSVWTIGLDVFDPSVMERCEVGRREKETGVALVVAKPEQGATVRNPTMEVAIEGSVRMNGLEGSEYDVVLALDRSEATRRGDVDLLAGELDAAQAFVESLRPRLGAVRVGIVSSPNLPPLPGDGGTGAHREVALGNDPAALDAALRGLRARGASGIPTFLSVFDYALDELDPAQGRGARPHARKVLVLVTNARDRLPFGPGADEDPGFAAKLAALAERARDRGVTLHLVGLAGVADVTPKSVESALRTSGGSLHRIASAAVSTPFLDDVPLPELRAVTIENRTAELPPRDAAIQPDGRFAITLPAAPGPNELKLRATLSDGATVERDWDFRFDESWVRERLLAAEAERLRRARQEKRLRLDPQWQQPDPAPVGQTGPAPAPE
ncbi:MAG TPA: vWA domain-containing protein [Myxococcota bacterium]|nr:vWA domain-containing protein [Myxococcota bacterium]